MSIMSRLKDLFTERKSIYSQYSNEILAEIADNVLPAVLEIMELSDEDLKLLEWREIHQAVLEDDNYLVVGGIIYYETLSDEEGLDLGKLVSVAIPLELAETGTKEEIVDHIKESQERLRREYESIYGEQQVLDIGRDFDYSDLSEKQREALLMGSVAVSKRNKLN